MAARGRRVFLPRENPFLGMDDTKIKKAYRFTRQGIHFLVNLLRGDIQPRTNRNKSLAVIVQVCIALMYFAGGSLLSQVARAHRVSIATVSRCIRRVTLALVRRRSQFIKFPTGADADRVKNEFFAIAGFPSVLGAVDCTHVGLNSSILGVNEHVYVNRKFRHTINVQMVCDAKYVITNVVARWPGSVHDARILQMSHLGRFLQNRGDSGFLLGDSGYPLRRWVQTPFGENKDDTPPKRAYNRAHARTRCLIEMTFGQLKNKFRCLKGQGMQMAPRRVCDVVVACAVLHNISKFLNEPDDEVDEEEVVAEDDEQEVGNVEEDNDDHEYQVGQMVQMDIVNDFFS
ncbi:putative nuclease HARBI1 [Diadema antillarum]|uniref:putative nuclease HARBI1 n=1 Tax=Diadema antillarum TaxID=105358 RepID=UPI003A8B0CEF